MANLRDFPSSDYRIEKKMMTLTNDKIIWKHGSKNVDILAETEGLEKVIWV